MSSALSLWIHYPWPVPLVSRLAQESFKKKGTVAATHKAAASRRALVLIWVITQSQFSRSVMSKSLQPHGLQHPRLTCPSPTLGAYSISCPWSWWCHPTVLSSIIPFCSCLQSFPASGSLATKFVLICYSSHRKWRHHLSRILSTTC